MSDFPRDVALPKAEIHVTELCNNRCRFCTTSWLNDENRDGLVHIPRAEISQRMREAFERGARRVLFQGGEPTLRRDLGDIVEEARSMGFQATTIFTNARAAASDVGLHWLVSMRASWFQVSIQGGTEAMHDASVDAPGAFRQTFLGARRLREAGQRVKINAVLTVHLLDSLADFAERMIELAPEEIAFDMVHPSDAFGPGRARFGDQCPRIGPYAVALRDALETMHAAGVVAHVTNFPPCLAPGVAPFVSLEARTVLNNGSDRRMRLKQAWRDSMHVKLEACASCAYDDACGGVYSSYLDTHGSEEVQPLADRSPPVAMPRRFGTGGHEPAPDSAVTASLRTLLARDAWVRVVRARADGSEELLCGTEPGSVRLVLAPVDAGRPAYATTRRFSIAYQRGPNEPQPDLLLIDRVVAAVRLIEDQLPAR